MWPAGRAVARRRASARAVVGAPARRPARASRAPRRRVKALRAEEISARVRGSSKTDAAVGIPAGLS